VTCFAAFLWWDSRPENPAPVFHLRMISRQAALRASFFVILIVGAILGAGLFVVPQYLRTVQDYSATRPAALFRCTPSAWGWERCLLCAS
jgi:MFS transporter, DHA2 family, multidrug resistance protein